MDAIHTPEPGGPKDKSTRNLFNIVSEIGEETPTTALDLSGHEPIRREFSSAINPLTNSSTINSSTSPFVAISVPDSKANFDSAEPSDFAPDLGGGSDIDIGDKGHSQARTQSQPHSRSTSLSLPGEYTESTPAPPLPLITLLCHASDLLAEYPPSSPMLRLTETFGSHSALRTNCLTLPNLLTGLPDDVAESFVGSDRVVLPTSQEDEDEESFHTKRSRNRESDREKMRNGRPIRITNGLVVRRQTVVAGVVLLLGVAVALYGFTPGGKPGRNGGTNIGSSNMRFAAAWIGGLLGVGELRIGL